MTHAEYEKKRLEIIERGLRWVIATNPTHAEVSDLARTMARDLDALALEIDPFENYELKRKEGVPGEGGRR